jgi:hypothetical protein
VRSLFWPLFACSACVQLATVVADPKVERAALASVRFVGVGSASLCVGGTTGDGAALASDRFAGEGSDSHRFGGHDT